MALKVSQSIIKGWLFENLLLEFYRYVPQQPEKLPAHCHDEYQFCLSVNYPSEYYYRKAIHFVPAGSLSVIHPGEMHSGTGRDIGDRQTPATFRMLYISPDTVNSVVSEIADRKTNLPFFQNSIILDTALAQNFLDFHRASQGIVSKLEQDSLLLSLLARLVASHTDIILESRPVGKERNAIRRVRDYLKEHFWEDVTLNHLAQIADLSSYYLSRVFKAEVGISLKQYQTQVRINRTKLLIAQGVPIRQVATDTGFVDQSHLTHHFKRLVQTTPKRYSSQDRKNLQDMTS